MMSNLFLHPALPLLVGSILIFIVKTKVNIISIVSLIISFIFLLLLPIGSNTDFILESMSLKIISSTKLSFLFCLVFLILGIVGKIFSIYQKSISEKSLVLLYIASAVGVIFSGDFIVLYIFWEMMAISSTLVIWSSSSPSAMKSGQRYLLVHLIGGLILLVGILGMYSETQNLAIRILQLDEWYTWFVLLGLLLNAGAPPFSQWVADSYPEGSYSSTVFLSAYTTKTAVFVLMSTFAGTKLLIMVGIYMIMYGIIYALLENDIRRILSYSIVNQVGFMIVGIGIGSELALNGTASHAFTHIIYKGLLLMSAGSVIFMTGKRKCTDVGGLYKTMPLTATCGIIGAFAISAFPLTSGFISKSMILEASYYANFEIVWLFLLIGSAGVFLHAGIKFPWFVFFHRDKKIDTSDPPVFMKTAMVTLSFLCIFLGIFPSHLYSILPFENSYIPYTANHVVSQLHLLVFSGLAFFMSLKYLERTLTITLDIDWIYRNKLIFLDNLYEQINKTVSNLGRIIWSSFSKLRLEYIENVLLNQATITVMMTIILFIFATILLLNV